MGLTLSVCCYSIAMLPMIALVSFTLWNIVFLHELKVDHRNPIDHCKTMNPLVLPEYLIHVFCAVLFSAADRHTLGFNVPLLAYHIRSYVSRPVMSGPGLYDPTTITRADVLAYYQKEAWCKLAFYLSSVLFLYARLYSLLT